MGQYNVSLTIEKPFKKIRERDWEKLEKKAVEELFKIIGKHIRGHVMSEEDSKTTVLEYSVIAETPHTYPCKKDKKNIKINHL